MKKEIRLELFESDIDVLLEVHNKIVGWIVTYGKATVGDYYDLMKSMRLDYPKTILYAWYKIGWTDADIPNINIEHIDNNVVLKMPETSVIE